MTRKRDQLIDAAVDLFYRNGFNATGIDRILSEAGVAKMTLYNHFASKDELILAALRRRDLSFREGLIGYVESHADSPKASLLALFDAHRAWFEQSGFRGCMFINAAAEFAGISDSIRQVADAHKKLVHAYVRGLARAVGARDPDELADQMMLLLDGAISCRQISCLSVWADRARAAAAVLIDHATAVKDHLIAT